MELKSLKNLTKQHSVGDTDLLFISFDTDLFFLIYKSVYNNINKLIIKKIQAINENDCIDAAIHHFNINSYYSFNSNDDGIKKLVELLTMGLRFYKQLVVSCNVCTIRTMEDLDNNDQCDSILKSLISKFEYDDGHIFNKRINRFNTLSLHTGLDYPYWVPGIKIPLKATGCIDLELIGQYLINQITKSLL